MQKNIESKEIMTIYRNAIDQLAEWKNKKERNPILIQGARQIGKTWVMKEFGKRHFRNVLEVNFDMHQDIAELFKRTKDPHRLISELQLFADFKIEAGQTLLIFDEIQASEEALNSLKYFAELMPDLHIVAAGSLLGVAVKHKNMTVPVGKVEILNMYPVSFDEYFHTSKPHLWEALQKAERPEALPVALLQSLNEHYRQYLICGGMPKAALAMLNGEGTSKVDEELHNIVAMYEADFSKYATSTEVIRIGQIWRSLPSQLAKENRKFIYKVVRTGARAREYEDALMWLQSAGLVCLVNAVSKAGLPLSAYKELSTFKVYSLDCGVLRYLCRLPAEALLGNTPAFAEMKGAVTENFVLQSILPYLECDPYYWTSDGKAEVDFVTQIGTDIVPIEVKAGASLSGQSLKSYSDKFQPKKMIRLAQTDLYVKENLLSVPLPLAFMFKKFFRQAIL